MIKCASSSKNVSIQEADYTKDTVKAGTDYVKEYVIEQEGNQQQVIMMNDRNIYPWITITKEELSLLDNHNLQQQPEEVQLEEEEVEHREEVHEPPEYTTIVYQDKVGVRS